MLPVVSDASVPRAGDRVGLRFGSRAITVEVLEDRGPFGPRDDRLLRVVWADHDPPLEFDIPASAVQR
jgi:hypothetical protein